MLIELQDVKKTFDEGESATHALRGISLSINKGEFVAIMGVSGSGKSTLLHILSFLSRPTSGRHFFDDKDVSNFSLMDLANLRNKSVGFVFQSFNLLARATVLENVELPMLYANIRPKERRQRALAVIERLGLGHRTKHLSNQLSGGEKQRVAIARALVNQPEVIFADEPTGNLDSSSGEQLMGVLEELHGEGKTIVLITHETYTAAFAERIIHIKDGLIEADTVVEERYSIKDHKFIK
ncbi:MAG: macrolide ABC transporter ATP-binding protein [Candidatus Terrybacteria bacterium RIFCSPLOWO2_01_FULL_40_23]|uniref:Macrolide ABC transporter ATP-binding protein n=1 Tax=Candidatus Terrybacteria bacterium RIFCSPLOWO2_01_FULL_40_23 TaxID=1802366 RepID=A0A1G2PUA9_9BACT|nr:MAG: macrolide ABC transporter ATP-binding protein [Candidatus Terrybacteria bacterium RIFCSPLOWO2_01_FULL_40_23]